MGRNTFSLLGKGNSIDEVEADVKKLEKEQVSLIELKERAESSEFVEKEAREKLGLVKPGDVVVVLPPEEILIKLAPSLDKQTFIEEKPIWERWSKMFLGL
ncbi:MAG: hypothetical protein A3D24_02300 [Candidatus Blackburnbacteria bacterium RIFCSPHIGHO2_02_FULL_39_13]|nr:MAG: hypothetical protein A2694_02880 [Candidatus Blackburnbacteria bacterium RIFCSPHIGHO2_01_FULL_40_17]OGY09514.1 MAG: hypothetical protein A3D24_02300 [Candidatus Blackburnbacteria bacterium RIFCSPHIGHO2_02_FULL_39_13]